MRTLLFLAALTAPALAQENQSRGGDRDLPLQTSAPAPRPQTIDLTRARAELSRSVHIDTVEGRIWARGRDYKATFGRDGLTFIPFLGAGAPHNYPMTFALESILAGGDDIALASDEAVQKGGRITIDRGIIDEVYEPGVDGVEQSFVIERRPASGPCVLRVAVCGELQLDASSDAIRFVNERGGVEFGAAFAVADDGSKTALSTSFVNGRIEIALTDDLLANARYPLVVDPILTTFALPNGIHGYQPTVGLDVAFDASTNRALYVAEEYYSDTDHDVFAILVDGSGAFLSSGYYDYTGYDWNTVSVANNASADAFLTVASVSDVPPAPRRVLGVLQRLLPTPSATLLYLASSSVDLVHPDVGGNPASYGTWFCVVYERVKSATDHDIEYCVVDGVGNVVYSFQALDTSTGTLDEYPRISKGTGFFSWNIVWQRQTAAAHHDVYGASVWDGGGLARPSHPVLVDPLVERRTPVPTCDLDFTHSAVFMIASAGSLSTVQAAIVDGVSTPVPVSVPMTSGVWGSALDVDTDGRRMLATFGEYDSGGTGDAKVCEFQRVDGAWKAVRSNVTISVNSPASIWATTVVCRATGGGTSPDALLGCADSDPLFTTVSRTGELYTHAPEGAATNGEFVTAVCLGYGPGATACPCGNNGASGGGCGSSVSPNGARLAGLQTAEIGADTFVLSAQDMPNGGTLYFEGTALQASGAGVVFGDGLLCMAGTITRLGVKINVGGQSQFPGSGDPAISLLAGIAEPGTRFYQAWYRDSASFCTPGTFNLTNALKVIWLW